MPIYLVERDLKGIAMIHGVAAQQRAVKIAARHRGIRYVQSMYTPADGHCFCLFEATTLEDVKRLNDEANLPYSRVLEALDLTP